MIAQLTGNFLHKTPTRVVMDVHGVGYEVNISLNTYAAINTATAGTLLTFLKVSEDAFTLYGFAEQAEKEIFMKLIGVSGVGSATARMMVSSLKPAEIQQAIALNQVKVLEAIKGIGKKTAERIVLELRDKVSALPQSSTNPASIHNTSLTEALEGLIALGINKTVAENAVKKVWSQQTSGEIGVEMLIKQALKSL